MRKIANRTMGVAFAGISLLLGADCSQMQQTQKAVGEEEPPLATDVLASGTMGAVEARPPSRPRRPVNEIGRASCRERV